MNGFSFSLGTGANWAVLRRKVECYVSTVNLLTSDVKSTIMEWTVSIVDLMSQTLLWQCFNCCYSMENGDGELTRKFQMLWKPLAVISSMATAVEFFISNVVINSDRKWPSEMTVKHTMTTSSRPLVSWLPMYTTPTKFFNLQGHLMSLCSRH